MPSNMPSNIPSDKYARTHAPTHRDSSITTRASPFASSSVRLAQLDIEALFAKLRTDEEACHAITDEVVRRNVEEEIDTFNDTGICGRTSVADDALLEAMIDAIISSRIAELYVDMHRSYNAILEHYNVSSNANVIGRKLFY